MSAKDKVLMRLREGLKVNSNLLLMGGFFYSMEKKKSHINKKSLKVLFLLWWDSVFGVGGIYNGCTEIVQVEYRTSLCVT